MIQEEMLYDVIYSYKNEDIYFRRRVTWTEAEKAKELLISEGIPEPEIYILLSDRFFK